MWGPSDEDLRLFGWVIVILGVIALAIAFALGAWLV